MPSTKKYPKPYKNCSKIQQINTITIQEEGTVINSIYPKLEPPTMVFNAENSDKLNIGYWSKNRLSKSLTKYYFNNGSF